MKTKHGEKLSALGAALAGVYRGVNEAEHMDAQGVYTARCVGPREEVRAEYCRLRDELEAFEKAGNEIERIRIQSLMEPMLEEKFTDTFSNLVTTAGKNDALDKHLAGSGYTAAWYMGLISSTSYSAVAAADTMGSHAGWLEAGIANAPTYSQGARPTAAWSAAASGSKALSSALTFSITSTGTVKGCFLTSVSTKDGTTGILYSAGLFTGGDKVLANGDSLSVSYSASL